MPELTRRWSRPADVNPDAHCDRHERAGTSVAWRYRPRRRGHVACQRSPHVLIGSPFLLSELARVLRYPRMRKLHGLDDAEIDAYVQAIQSAALMVNLPAGIPAGCQRWRERAGFSASLTGIRIAWLAI